MAHPEDYNVGKTSKKNHESYDQSQTLGSYRTSEKQFPNPDGVVVFEGFGVTKKDLVRGFCDPAIRTNPQYDSDNYKLRWSIPRVSDLVEQGPEIPSDDEFRRKDLVTKGFLARPRIPTER